jgi:hypothetical protein
MKRHCYAPFIAVLFDRTIEVKTILPSGKEAVNIDDAPNILRMDTPDGFRYFEATADGYAEVTDPAKVEALSADFKEAPVAKRAPKT